MPKTLIVWGCPSYRKLLLLRINKYTYDYKLDCVAFHESNHAVAHILAGIPFKYVTIKEEKEDYETGQVSLGHIMHEKLKG